MALVTKKILIPDLPDIISDMGQVREILHQHRIAIDQLSSHIPMTFETLQVGEDSNYMEVLSDGEIRLHGTARTTNHVRVSAGSFKPGNQAPTEAFLGVFPILQYAAATDDEAHYSVEVPYRMEPGTEIVPVLNWTYQGAQDNGTVCWKIEFIFVAAGETVDGTTATLTETTAGSHATGKKIATTFSPAMTGGVAEDLAGIRVWRDTSGDTLAVAADFLELHLHFIRDRLGEAT